MGYSDFLAQAEHYDRTGILIDPTKKKSESRGGTRGQNKTHAPRMGEILTLAAQECDVPLNAMGAGLSRDSSYVRARQIAMYIANRHFCYTLPSIARAMGYKDHTTILHGARNIDAFILGLPFGRREAKTDFAIRSIVKRIIERLGAEETRDAKDIS